MKPFIHSELSVRKYGGKIEDYQKIHDWFDQTKAHHADMRHRAILHNAWGIFLCEQIFGTYITNSDGKVVQVRDIGEDHVLQDVGRIPSLTEFLSLIPMSEFSKFARPLVKKRIVDLKDIGKPKVEDFDDDPFADFGENDTVDLENRISHGDPDSLNIILD
jgi:hypothetical protein